MPLQLELLAPLPGLLIGGTAPLLEHPLDCLHAGVCGTRLAPLGLPLLALQIELGDPAVPFLMPY